MARSHEAKLAAGRRYRERHREELRTKARAYQTRKTREAGMPALGTPESTANRRNARKLSGPDHANWKGDAVSYKALHAWVSRHKTRTGVCSDCGDGSRRTHWANVSGEYRRDLDDFIEVCVFCHRRRDRDSYVKQEGAVS